MVLAAVGVGAKKTKNVMQEKLIAVVYSLRTYWNQFSLGGICKQEWCLSVRLVSEEVKSIAFW